MKSNEQVVILHGIFRSKRHMRKLAAVVEGQGYEVFNLNYPSTDLPLEELVEHIWKDISELISDDQPVHFIGYSMGGLLTRAILCKYKLKNLGKVLLLAAPNKGSEVADFLKNNIIYKKLYGPAGQQLTTNQESIKHLFANPDYKAGVIAGNFSIDPLCSMFIKGAGDGKVSIESTKLDNMQDHIIVKASHTFFPHNKEVHKQALYFLEHNKFDHKNT